MTSTWALWIVTALYLGQGGIAGWHGQYPQALILGGYTIANLGLIWSMRGTP